MKELPLLMTAENIRATLEGRKTQFRQLIRNVPSCYDLANKPASYGPYDYAFVDMADPIGTYPTLAEARYHVGDHCWLKEPWKITNWSVDGDGWGITYKDGTYRHYTPTEEQCDADKCERYIIDCSDECLAAGVKTDDEGYFILRGQECPTRWRSPIFMPKWAACRWVKILKVLDPHRIQEISEEDARAEGINDFGIPTNDDLRRDKIVDCRFAYRWESIHGSGSWAENKWVFPYEYEVIEK